MVAHVDVSPGDSPWLRLARRAKLLAKLTLVWLGIEGTVGVVAGILAGSIALVALGLDSAIEGLPASSSFGASPEPGQFQRAPSAARKNGWPSASSSSRPTWQPKRLKP